MYSYIADNQKHHPVLNDPSLVSFPEKFACSHRICVFFFSLGLCMQHVSDEVGPLNCLQV